MWSYKFDYVHGRYIVPYLADMPKLMRNIFANLTPGGYLELLEAPMWFQSVDDTLEGTAMKKWNDVMLEGTTASTQTRLRPSTNISGTPGVKRIGRDPMAAVHLHEQMADAGFTNITEKKIAVPINSWAKGRDQKIIGTLQMMSLLEVAHGITMTVFTKAMGWSVEEVEVLLAQVRKDLQDKRIHAFLTM